MPLRSDWSTELCPIRRALDVLGDPWVLVIMRDVLQGKGRFDDFKRNLGISDAVLSRRLSAMVAEGLLLKADYRDGTRTRQEYRSTEAGAELLPLLQNLAIWAERHTPMPSDGAHMALFHTLCGAETTNGEVCSNCGTALKAEEMSWIKEWDDTVQPLVGPASTDTAS